MVSPMDFQYDDNKGKVDPKSPWVANTPNRLASFSSESFARPKSQKPPSPLRQKSAQSDRLPIANTPKAMPRAFTDIRDKREYEFSSEAENPSSPEHADNENTPEYARAKHPELNGNVTTFRGNGGSPTKLFFTGIRDTLQRRLSPRGGDRYRKRDTDVIMKRAHKRKRRELEKENRVAHRRSSTDSENEDQAHSSGKDAPSSAIPPNALGAIPSLFSYIETHPNLPHILSWYAQLLLNFFLIIFFMYIIWSFWATIRMDVDMKSEEATQEILAEMAVCAREYVDNRCGRDSRVPAMEIVCNNWEKCMNKDPNRVGRARVSAHTFAQIFNDFIEPISYKAMIFCSVLVFGCVAISNLAFGFFRNKGHPPPPPYMQSQYQGSQHGYAGSEQFFTPHTPHRNVSGNGGFDFIADTGDRGSPTKRIGYR